MRVHPMQFQTLAAAVHGQRAASIRHPNQLQHDRSMICSSATVQSMAPASANPSRPALHPTSSSSGPVPASSTHEKGLYMHPRKSNGLHPPPPPPPKVLQPNGPFVAGTSKPGLCPVSSPAQEPMQPQKPSPATSVPQVADLGNSSQQLFVFGDGLPPEAGMHRVNSPFSLEAYRHHRAVCDTPVPRMFALQ